MPREELLSIGIFRNMLEDPATAARAWKAQGKKVVGYRCIYVPEEIIWGAGMLPLPLYGTPRPIVAADAYLQPCTCEFIRNIFDIALGGGYRHLDGIALCNTCDVMRRLPDLWSTYCGNTPVCMLNNPQKLGSGENRDYFREELDRFRNWTAGIAGKEISDDAIASSIALYNGIRALMRELAALAAQDTQLLSGREVFEIAMASSLLPRDKVPGLLRQVIGEARERRPSSAAGPRIFVTGSVIDNPSLFGMIEEEGGIVVGDDLCSSLRPFRRDAAPAGDPLESLYRRLNGIPLCACMHPGDARIDYLPELIRQHRADGVINCTLKYCHPSLYEAPLLSAALDRAGIPSLVLEIGHDLSGHGQLRTRIQAFIEMLGI